MGPVAIAMLACMSCHQAIVESYLKTGMGRSFFQLAESNRVEDFSRRNSFYHEPSKSRFTMTARSGRFFMKREHPNGTLEKQIHYALGSGNHARSYVNRTPQGRLLALPVSWYAEKGGYWEMAPGYDRPDHAGMRRKINYECFFCHNAYPKIPAVDLDDPVYLEPLPLGIDCARCHGPAEEHLRTPGRGTILNPRKLSTERQLEICMQCHLEPTSQPLPHALRRYDRAPFSFRPGEPLADFKVYFDHPANTAHSEKFEVVSAPYRLKKSACFLKSGGRMTCSTCHDAHRREAKNSCVGCHAEAHNQEQDCAACHMAKRRPEDARRTTLTDHFIQRVPGKADGPELPPYKGPVMAYYPPEVDALYAAVAQVKDGTNLERGIDQLRQFQKTFPRAKFGLELAEAYRNAGRAQEAIPLYEWALQKMPSLMAAWRGLGLSRYPAVEPLLGGLKHSPADAFLLTLLGTARSNEADLRAAIAADPDLPEAYVNLGTILARKGQREQAAALFRKALAVDPQNRAAEANLRLALSGAAR
ncbi:MAG TPA: tetratricopeptide repeat protein [Bryobacteraceae bacterium]|nr:tetratricopeptide repeat protein [Bryobacteraceae bacterium]